MAIMYSGLNTHNLIIVILLFSLALISTAVGQDRDKKWSKRPRRINCAIYVFAPRCRGVSAKRSSTGVYPASLPLSKDVPEVYQLFKNSLPKEEQESLSPLPGLILPNSYSHQTISKSKLRRLQRLQEEQQEQQHHQHLQQQPMLRTLLQLLLERSAQQPEDEESRTRRNRNLLEALRRKRRQVSSELDVFSSILYPYKSNEDNRV